MPEEEEPSARPGIFRLPGLRVATLPEEGPVVGRDWHPRTSAHEDALALRDLAAAAQRRRISHEVQRRFAAAYECRSTSEFVDGLIPLPFDVFFRAVTGVHLTPRQRWVFGRARLLRATDLFARDRVVQTLVLIWGKGSGKDMTIAALFAWVAYVLMSYRNDPARPLFDLAPNTKLEVMNVAPDQETAKTVFFAYLRKFTQHPLVRRFAPVVTTEEVRFFRNDASGTPYECLTFYSKHSNASGIEGHNLILWVGDELDGIETTADGRDRAMELYGVMRSSASTRVGNRWIGAMISYPRTEDGCMMQLKKRAEADAERMGEASGYLVDLAATHEVRPGVDRYNVKSIEEDFRYDPRGARARYLCQPSSASEPFFEFPEKIADALRPDMAPVGLWRPALVARPHHSGTEREYVSVQFDRLAPEPGFSYFMGVDAGLTGDAAAIAVFALDERTGAAQWVCPDCGADPDNRRAATYERIEARSVDSAPLIGDRPDERTCGVCGVGMAMRLQPLQGIVQYRTGDWWRVAQADPDAPVPFTVGGVQIALPRVVERLIVTMQPDRGQHTSVVRPVDLGGFETVCRTLIERLRVKKALFDPWQMVSVAQALQGCGGCVVETASFSAAEQFRRARFLRALVYSDYLWLLDQREPDFDWVPGQRLGPTDQTGFTGERRRDVEWRRLEQKGTKIDHPPRGSKDIFDAESMAVWAAGTHFDSRLDVLWI